MESYLVCPNCGSAKIITNMVHLGNQSYRCLNCGHEFIDEPIWQPTLSAPRLPTAEQISLINTFLHLKTPIKTIASILQISEEWLHNYVTTNTMKPIHIEQVKSLKQHQHPMALVDRLCA